MRFLVSPTPSALGRARPPVRAFVLFAALSLAGYAAQRVRAGGLSSAEIEAAYLGFAGGEPLPATAVWEELHIGAFLYGFTLFVLGSVLAVSPVRPRVRSALLGAAAASALADLVAPFAIRAAHGMGGLRVATLVLAMGSLAALAATVAWRFGRPAPGRRADA